MSIVNIRNIEIVNNPAKFTDPYVIRIQFECIAPLKEDLEWKLIYVGAADSEKYDQELDSCMVGPIPVGLNSFEFSADAPSIAALPQPHAPPDLIGVTVIILSALYNDKEFVRVGYYVATNWESEEYALDVEEGRRKGEVEGLVRNVKVDNPRVTRFSNKWDAPESSVTSTTTSNPISSGSFDAPVLPSAGIAARDAAESPLPPPITAVLAAPTVTAAPVTPERSADPSPQADSPAGGPPHHLADAVELADKMGAETAGDEGRGEEAGEGLASYEGAALREM